MLLSRSMEALLVQPLGGVVSVSVAKVWFTTFEPAELAVKLVSGATSTW